MKSIQNKITFCNEENQIEMIFPEELELETLDEMLSIADNIISNLKKKNIRPKLLADVTLMKKLSTSSRQKGVNWVLSNGNLQIAIYGKNTFMKYFVNFLTIATGKYGSMKFFKTRKTAIEWLNDLSNRYEESKENNGHH